MGLFESLPTDWLPNALADDCSDALEFWLKNPLLVFHYPGKMAASERAAAEFDLKQRRELLWNLRTRRGVVRSSRRNPTAADGLPVADMEAVYLVTDLIEDRAQRGEVTRFAMRLADCERPWLLDRLNQVLEVRERGLAA